MDDLIPTDDKKLVLYHWLSSFSESDAFDSLGDAEKRVLWDLEASLEKKLTALFKGDYAAKVSQAASRIAEPESE